MTVIIILNLCFPVYRSYRDGDLRLVGGANNWEGRVEIFWNGDWGAISDSLWSTADANVVCRQLLHSPESGTSNMIAFFTILYCRFIHTIH